MQPFHVWHKNVISTSLKNNSKTIIFIGSTNVSWLQNPLWFKERKDILYLLYEKELQEGSILILPLDDNSNEYLWIVSIIDQLKKILSNTNITITFYCGDLKKDYAIKIITKFKNLFLEHWKTNFYEVWRQNSLILVRWVLHKISGTLIRDLLKRKDYKNIQRIVPEEIIETLKEIW